MKVNVIIKGERRWDYELRQRHNPSLAGTTGWRGGVGSKKRHITMKGRSRLCLGEKRFIYNESRGRPTGQTAEGGKENRNLKVVCG